MSDRKVPSLGWTLRALLGLTAAWLATGASPAQATFAASSGPIAFQRFLDPRDENSSQIFSIDAIGGPVSQLTMPPGGGFSPDFSPDGSALAVERRFGPTRRDGIFSAPRTGGAAVELSTGCAGRCLGDGGPAWSPDGRHVLFHRVFGPVVRGNAAEVDLMVMNRDGSGRRLIRRLGVRRDGREPHDFQYSPDGRRIAITLETLGRDGHHPKSAVYVIDLKDHRLHRITPFRLYGGNVDWSPDGRRIVFNSYWDAPPDAELWVVRPDGHALRRVRRVHGGQSDFEPVWSPDGRQIAFSHATPHGPPHIWTMSADGTHAQQLTKGPFGDIQPDWGAA